MISENQRVTYTGKETYSLPMSSNLTHFLSVALTKSSVKNSLEDYQRKVLALFTKDEQKNFEINSPLRFHLNLGLVRLDTPEKKQAVVDIMKHSEEFIKKTLSEKLELGPPRILEKQWPDGPLYLVFCAEILNPRMLEIVSDHLIRQMIEAKIIDENDKEGVALAQLALNTKTNLWSETNIFVRLFQIKKTQETPNYADKLAELAGERPEPIEMSFFDISVRREFDEEQYYKPFVRVGL